jgi:hypothetical protein
MRKYKQHTDYLAGTLAEKHEKESFWCAVPIDIKILVVLKSFVTYYPASCRSLDDWRQWTWSSNLRGCDNFVAGCSAPHQFGNAIESGNSIWDLWDVTESLDVRH